MWNTSAAVVRATKAAALPQHSIGNAFGDNGRTNCVPCGVLRRCWFALRKLRLCRSTPIDSDKTLDDTSSHACVAYRHSICLSIGLPGHLRVATDAGRRSTGQAGGQKAHPITRGFACVKMSHYPTRQHHPDRSHEPLRRVGKKGQGKFEPIGWDEALDESRPGYQTY